MSTGRSKHKYNSLSAPTIPGGTVSDDLPPLRSSGFGLPKEAEPQTISSPGSRSRPTQVPEQHPAPTPTAAEAIPSSPTPARGTKEDELRKQAAKDEKLLIRDRWLVRNGHTLTFVGLYLFSIMVLYRPYELVPGLGFLASTAFYFALATLLIYLPSQFASDGNLTIMSTDVKAVLALAFIALITIPIARDPARAWATFNEPFIKAVIMFIVMVNVIRTRRRLMQMMWVSISVAIYLSWASIAMYMEGKFTVDAYRVGVDVGGLFGNTNDMALHFVMMTPLVIALGIGATSKIWRVVYFASAALFVGANMVTFSRGGFLGLVAAVAVLAWKIGRKHRFNVAVASLVAGFLVMVAAPGNFGLRMLSIFVPELDNGSNDQRRELLERSLVVTARNPWGIGIGNFPLVGIHDRETHNAFTQVSSELGLLGLAAYLVFIISPFRKLRAIERTLFNSQEHAWYYYMSIGLQASIVGYLVSSFFGSVAYNWFIYFLIAYAVAFRRIYSIESGTAARASSIVPAVPEAVPA